MFGFGATLSAQGAGVGHKAGFSKPKSGFDFRNNYLFLKRYICIHTICFELKYNSDMKLTQINPSIF